MRRSVPTGGASSLQLTPHSATLSQIENPKPMNETTQLNTELLSADARGRKHIPVAVFAVIIIHVALFLVLLIAAGCRSSARVKSTTPAPAAAEQRDMTQPPIADPIALQPAQPIVTPSEVAVVATEPQVDAEPLPQPAPQPQRRVTQQSPAPKPVAVKPT